MRKLKLVNGRTAEQWAEIIKAKWQDSVNGILEVGLLLHNAREELDTAEFWTMTRDQLNFAQATVYHLIAVGTDLRLQDCNMLQLPASWGTLYELHRLTDEQFQHGIETGIICAGMERKDIAQLKPPKTKRRRKASPIFPVDHPIEEYATSMRTNVFGWLSDIRFEEWRPLLIRLRDELLEIEREFPAVEEEMRKEGKAT
jgi:hypothetical protein